MSKHIRNPIRELCVGIVRTDSRRQEHISRLEAEKEELRNRLGGQYMDGMPRGSGMSKPVEQTYIQIAKLDCIINDEQRRVDAVAEAADVIGWQYDYDTQKAMRECIVKNVKGGYGVSFRALNNYPFGQEHFYQARAEFLRNVGKKLNLISKY